MNRRCPQNKLVGLGVRQGWKLIINERGFVNIIPSPEDYEFGLVYEISPSDEERLDRSEGVPLAYTNHVMDLGFQPNGGKQRVVKALIYIDMRRVGEGRPSPGYIRRMNKGIVDAIKEGIPIQYIEKYLRRFIPALLGGVVEAWEGDDATAAEVEEVESGAE